jgi:CBS domain-containing protein
MADNAAFLEGRIMTTVAADVMTSPAITVTPNTPVAEIARLMTEKRISAVPVCHTDGTLVGMVSEDDIIRPFRESVRSRRDWWLGVIAEGEEVAQDFLEFLRPDNRTAEAIMTRHVITVGRDARLPELAELMIKHRIKRVPVVADDRVVGIVSRSDLVTAIARTPAMLV